ncbi:MAG: hypothetical protein V7609_3457 [Verrucomicrobiota bacterium]
MTIPFLSYFTKGKEKVAVAKKAPMKPAVALFEKPSSERFSKTVMPNATRTISPQDPFQQMASRSSAMGGPPAAATMVAPRTISFADSPAPARTRGGLPPAVALALEPKVERVISLELADVVAGMPADHLKPLGEDANRRILLKASEVEKGMANGKPTVSLATIYQQVPEIFLRTVAPSDTNQVPLPFAKVLDQFTSLHVRGDQERHLAVPQVDTPFLKAAVEDSSRFGTTMEPLEMQPGDLPSVRIEPPTAEAFAAAEPEPATNGKSPYLAAPQAREKTNGAPTRIPFKLSPNGTDAPAPESVPASSGPSVPNLLPSPPAPVRIPFKMSPPSDDVRPKPEPWLTAESIAASGEPAAAPVSAPTVARSSEVMIALPLKPILQALAPIQLSGDPGSVPEDARIELPFALIEPQLAVGRISVTPKVFEVSLPAEYRAIFKSGEGAADVSLPLQEVLKNLPTASLRMRDDQVEQEAGSNFATPFSAKAEEDAKRFNVPATPVAKPVVVEAAPAAENEAADTAATTAASDRPLRTPLQVALDTDEKLDAKGIVAQINKIPGVKSCAILFGDGLSLAGTLPAELETDGLCAMAPALMQRIENHLVDTKLGTIKGMTLSCTKGAVTFFMHENLCLAALHANLDLPTEAREKLGRVVHELSRKYSHPV